MTWTEQFMNKKESRNVVLVLVSGDQSSINYDHRDNSDIYIITNPIAFLNYITDIICRDYAEKYVLVSIHEMSDLVKVLKSLYNGDQIQSDQKEKYHHRFIDQYNHYLHTEDINQIGLVPDVGHGDKPFAFELIVTMDAYGLSLANNISYGGSTNNPNSISLTVDSIYTHQYLRYFALKHGGTFIIIENLTKLITEPSQFITQIRSINEPQPIFESGKKKSSSHHSNISLFIPKGWDSWNKITLISKSSIFHDDNTLLNTVETIQQVDSTYNQYLTEENGDSRLSLNSQSILFLDPSNPTTTTHNKPIPSLTFHAILSQALQ